MKGALRWKCEDQGCYAEKTKPHLEEISSALPGAVAFSDVDAIVERRGWFLILEFKQAPAKALPTGQRILLEALSRLSPRIAVAVVYLDGNDGMVARAIQVCRLGQWQPIEVCTTERLHQRVASWARRVEARQ